MKIGVFGPAGSAWPKISGRRGRPRQPSSCQKTRTNNFYAVYECGHKFLSFCYMHAFDRRTERPWQYRALHYMQSRGKNDGEHILFGNIDRLFSSVALSFHSL